MEGTIDIYNEVKEEVSQDDLKEIKSFFANKEE